MGWIASRRWPLLSIDCACSLGVTTLVYFYQSDRNSSRVLLKKPDMVFWCDTQQGEGGICLLKCSSLDSLYSQEAEHIWGAIRLFLKWKSTFSQQNQIWEVLFLPTEHTGSPNIQHGCRQLYFSGWLLPFDQIFQASVQVKWQKYFSAAFEAEVLPSGDKPFAQNCSTKKLKKDLFFLWISVFYECVES